MKQAVHIGGPASAGPDLQELLGQVARGDQEAFARVYDLVSGPVLGLVRSVLRDPAQSEEVTQEVLLEVWRSAPRYQASRGSGMTWVLTLAHRRAVDRVRSAQASSDREHRAALLDRTPAFDEVTEQVESRLEREQVRRCLRTSPSSSASRSPWRTTRGSPTARWPNCCPCRSARSRPDCATD